MRYRIVGTLFGLVAGIVIGTVWRASPDAATSNIRGTTTPRFEAQDTRQLPDELAAPSLHVDPAGLVTGHFDRVPRSWLLDALERSGVVVSPPVAQPLPEAPAVVVANQDADEPIILSEAIRALHGGAEAERYAVLTQAVHAGLELPPGELIDTFQRESSDRVAMLAFSTYIDSVAEDADAAREGLAWGLESTNAAVREDAARRMIELESLARVQASMPEQGMQ